MRGVVRFINKMLMFSGFSEKYINKVVQNEVTVCFCINFRDIFDIRVGCLQPAELEGGRTGGTFKPRKNTNRLHRKGDVKKLSVQVGEIKLHF